MIPLTFEVPEALSDPLVYERVGAIIKERATGQIAGHIQQLGGWDLLRHVPIPGGNPLELATQAIQMAQLHKIQQTLNTVQTLATVGAVASVATLGVSVAGFAAVLSKLKRMEGKLDQMLAVTVKVRSLVEHLHVKVDALPMAALQARLEAVSMARLYDKTRRRDALQDAVENLAELRHYYGALLASQQFCALAQKISCHFSTRRSGWWPPARGNYSQNSCWMVTRGLSLSDGGIRTTSSMPLLGRHHSPFTN